MAFRLWQPKLTYKCACCGKTYKGSPSFAYHKPCYYFDVPEQEREARIKIDSDLCYVRATPDETSDNDIYAIRCTLDIPIIGIKEPFCWGVWVSQSKQSFERYIESYDTDQSSDGSFGWLALNMPYYNRSGPGEELENLACDLHWGSKGARPKVILHECDHPLYSDQVKGIDWKTAVNIAQTFLNIAHRSV